MIEAIAERLELKRELFARVDALRRPGSWISSNTSGLPISALIAGRSDDFARHFLVTHFFNPVRYMRLLELVAGPRTDPALLEAVAELGRSVLGKGIVWGKDTPNFVANRIGTYGLFFLLHEAERAGFTVEEIDALFGEPLGRPKSAIFRTADLVGLDTLIHVADHCYAALPDDECRETFAIPSFLRELVARGWLGQKSGQGFYKKEGAALLALDLTTLTYRPSQKVRVDSIGAVRTIEAAGERIAKLLAHGDRLSQLAWRATAHTLIYAARRLGEIADDVVNVDHALRWGFNWELGPFELWDAIGVGPSVERMRQEGLVVPERVERLLASGASSFYGGNAARPTYFDFATGAPQPCARDPRQLSLPALRVTPGELERNAGASLYDLGDGVLGLEFHTKMNALDGDVIGMLHRALDRAEDESWAGVVVGNEHPRAFCAGANLFAILVAARQQQWPTIDRLVRGLQRATQRLRQCSVPVVVAPAGLALGGGTELLMGADAVHAHAETYLGLVEIAVGLLPAGGGCWGLLERWCGGLPDDPSVDPLPLIKQAFSAIAMGKVSTGAEDARRLGFLRPHDSVGFDRELLLYQAKQRVLGLARGGYRPPRPLKLRLPGASGAANFRWFVDDLRQGQRVTAHEATIAGKIAHVLCGGDTSMRCYVDQQRILELEREAFMSLVAEPKTQQRIQHMLEHGKPLRN